MDVVEKNVQRDQMKIGIGTDSHVEALRMAGADNIIQRAKVIDMMDDLPMRNFIFRPGDVVVLAQPKVLTLDQIKVIAEHGVTFEVIGHEPMACKNDADRRILRNMKPTGIKVESVERRGAKPIYPQPTEAQMDTIKALWYSDASRAKIVADVAAMMGAPVKMSWVRDKMIKATGHARRTPD